MIDLSPTTLVHAIYFVQVSEMADFMGAVTRAPGEPWKFTYRFRVYRDERAHDSEDEKMWCCLTHVTEDPEEVGALAERMIAEVIVPNRKGRPEDLGPVHRVLVRGSGVDAVEALGRQPWAHVRVEGPAAGDA